MMLSVCLFSFVVLFLFDFNFGNNNHLGLLELEWENRMEWKEGRLVSSTSSLLRHRSWIGSGHVFCAMLYVLFLQCRK